MPAPQTQAAVAVRAFAQRFSATRRGARRARHVAVQQLNAWGVAPGSAVSDAVALVVAELAANAALHGRVPGRDFALRLTSDRDAALVRVEVSDAHDVRPVTGKPVTPATNDAHGRGLVLVDTLAARWGVSDRPGPGKAVWAEVATSPEWNEV